MITKLQSDKLKKEIKSTLLLDIIEELDDRIFNIERQDHREIEEYDDSNIISCIEELERRIVLIENKNS
jgi:hypothetical protein